MPREPRRFARTLRVAQTGAEAALWDRLRGRRLSGLKFKRQAPFLAYTVDFLCFERKLIIEVDGRQHVWFDDYDVRRTLEIEASGFRVVRFRNEEVLTDLDRVLETVLTLAAYPGREHPHPRPLSHPGEG